MPTTGRTARGRCQNLPPPRTWVDDLCSLEGIDYSELRDANPDPPNDPQAELDLIAGFADEYIGDYVDKMEELVAAKRTRIEE